MNEEEIDNQNIVEQSVKLENHLLTDQEKKELAEKVFNKLTGKMTPMTRQFLNPDGDYILKAIIIVMFVLGLIGIKRI